LQTDFLILSPRSIKKDAETRNDIFLYVYSFAAVILLYIAVYMSKGSEYKSG